MSHLRASGNKEDTRNPEQQPPPPQKKTQQKNKTKTQTQKNCLMLTHQKETQHITGLYILQFYADFVTCQICINLTDKK